MRSGITKRGPARGLGLSVVAALSVAATSARAATVYLETFGCVTANTRLTDPTNGDNPGGTKYTASGGATGADVTNGAGGPVFLSTGTGINAPSSAPQTNVNAGKSANGGAGVAYITVGSSVANADPVLIWTSDYAVDRTAKSVDTFSFYEGNANAVDALRVAVQIGGSWYVSNTAYTAAIASGGAFATTATLQTLNFTNAASAWSNLNFTPGTTLSVGSALTGALPDGNITAFGLYNPSRTANVRFDNLQITATPSTPEPAGLAIAAGLSASAIRRRRN